MSFDWKVMKRWEGRKVFDGDKKTRKNKEI